MEHIHQFQKLFGLPEKWKPYSEVDLPGGQWATIDMNRLGLIRLQLGEGDSIHATVAWFRGELAMAEGCNKALAQLIWIAEKVGLPTCSPVLEEIRTTETYRQAVEKDRLL